MDLCRRRVNSNKESTYHSRKVFYKFLLSLFVIILLLLLPHNNTSVQRGEVGKQLRIGNQDFLEDVGYRTGNLQHALCYFT